MSSIEKSFLSQFNAFVAIIGFILAFLCFPLVFDNLLSIGKINSYDRSWLYIFLLLFFLVSLILFLFRKKINSTSLALIYFGIQSLVLIEFSARAVIKIFASEKTISKFEEQYTITFNQSTAFNGHPFTQFTGKTGTSLKGSLALGDLNPFNNYGFPGVDFSIEKPKNVIRIACLGESTTADGYPGFLENYLNTNRPAMNVRYETMCFAHQYWTTAHTMSTFLMTVIDFKPDYLIIHHGWNEGKVMDVDPTIFRSDYSHTFKSFEKPEIPDASAIRLSIIYRYFKFKYDQSPSWLTMGAAIETGRKRETWNYATDSEYIPYQRNLETIINMAKFHGIKVLMTTLPHSTDPNIPMFGSYLCIDRCNIINRELATKYKDDLLFADIDSVMTGKMNSVFYDLGHVTDEGKKKKAEITGTILLQHSYTLAMQTEKLSASTCREEHIHAIEQKIKYDSEWLNSVKTKALMKLISVDKMVEKDAKYLYRSDSVAFLKRSVY